VSPDRPLVIAGRPLDRFWHCFGTERHRAPLDTVVQLLHTSGTNVLPINTHRLDGSRRPDALEHGFAGVTHRALADRVDLSGFVRMLNINLRTSAAAAVGAAKIAVELTGVTVLKLEVLTGDLRESADEEVIEAARELLRWEPSLVVLPLLSCRMDAAKSAFDAGCPLLRVMGSPIGSGDGLLDEASFAEICLLPVPVVLDGGVGRPADLARAARLGAWGALINSVLFDDGRAPVAVMAEYAAAARQAFPRSAER
jgi:thiazole synthase